MKNQISTILKFGLLSGVIFTAVMLIGVALVDPANPDLTAGFIVGTSGMVLAFLLLIPALKRLNSEEKQSFGKNILFCLIIVLIAAILYSLVWTVYVFYINPDIIDSMETFFMNDLKRQDLSPEKLAIAKEGVNDMIIRYSSPVQTFLWTLIEPSPAGVVMTLIASFVQRVKNNKVS